MVSKGFLVKNRMSFSESLFGMINRKNMSLFLLMFFSALILKLTLTLLFVLAMIYGGTKTYTEKSRCVDTFYFAKRVVIVTKVIKELFPKKSRD